jgi:hypothetical protein
MLNFATRRFLLDPTIGKIDAINQIMSLEELKTFKLYVV